MTKEKTESASQDLKNSQPNECPDQEFFNSLHLITVHKSYVPITNCLIEHIITATNLNNYEKLYYLLADSLSIINKNQGGSRSYALASKHWAKNLNCSRSLIFSMQKSLQEKGYFIIDKDFTACGLNKRNVIVPTIPQYIFDHLNDNYPDRIEVQNLPYHCLSENRRECLDSTKPFIKINYYLLKKIISNDLLNAQQKIMWLGFYNRSYKNYMLQKKYNHNNNFSFVISYQELTSFYSFSYKTISKSIKTLSKLGFIKATNFYIRNNNIQNHTKVNCYTPLSARKDKSLWRINVCLPDNFIFKLATTKDRSSIIKRNESKITTKELNKKTAIPNTTDHYAFNGHQIKFTLLPDNDELDYKQKDKLDKQSDNTFLESIPSYDPTFLKSRPQINKDSKLKKNISNLWGKPKVLFKKFMKKLTANSKPRKPKLFSLITELIREKLKLLPKDKADKARKFAYRLITKKLASGYAASLTINELTKELIYHAATWKPKRLGKLSRIQEIDVALTVAWKSVVNGKWQSPLSIVKTTVLDYEFRDHKEKYRLYGTISHELKNLALDAEKLLGKWYDLEAIIKTEVNFNQNKNRENSFDQTSSTADIENPNDKTNLLEIQESINQQNNMCVNLLSLSDEQKYLSISGTDTEIIKITSTDKHQFYGKLETMEINDKGSLVMTLIPKTQHEFFERYNANSLGIKQVDKKFMILPEEIT